jgi:hypothetical protein
MSVPPMRRTRPLDLLGPLVAVGVVAYVLLGFSYGSLPPFDYLLPVPIAALAVIELVMARRVRAAVRHDPGARPMTAIAIARCVALGKASSLVGSGVLGAAIALLLRVGPRSGTVTAAGHDTRVAALVLVGSGLLVGAGLLLERAGVDPNRDRDRDGSQERD